MEPHHLAVGPRGSRVWITDNAAGRALVVPAATGKRLRTLRTGPNPHHVAFRAGWTVVASHGAGTLDVCDPGGATTSIPVGRGPHGVALALTR